MQKQTKRRLCIYISLCILFIMSCTFIVDKIIINIFSINIIDNNLLFILNVFIVSTILFYLLLLGFSKLELKDNIFVNHIPSFIYNLYGYEYIIQDSICKINIDSIKINNNKYICEIGLDLLKLYDDLKNNIQCVVTIYRIKNNNNKIIKPYTFIIDTKYIISVVEEKMQYLNNTFSLEFDIPCEIMIIKNNFDEKIIEFLQIKNNQNSISLNQETNLVSIIQNKYYLQLSNLIKNNHYEKENFNKNNDENIVVNINDNICLKQNNLNWKTLFYNKKIKNDKNMNLNISKGFNNNYEKIDQNLNNSETIIFNNLIQNKIKEIDIKINNGYVFQSISIYQWQHIYKSEIIQLYKKYEKLSEEIENQIITILDELIDNMYDKKENDKILDQLTTVQALKDKLKMDGIEKDF